MRQVFYIGILSISSGYFYLFPFTGGVLNDFDSSVITNFYDSEVILLSPLSPNKCNSNKSTEVDYEKEPDYTGRTATVTTNFNPKRKDRDGVSKPYPLVRLPSDREEDYIPYNHYSALIGLLASSGARLEHGPVVS